MPVILRCMFGIHRYANPRVLETLGIWFVQCERCGRMMKVANALDSRHNKGTP